MQIPHFFCALPFIHHHVNTQGKMTPCCMNIEEMGDVHQHSMKEIFTSDHFNQLRAQMLQGGIPASCGSCSNLEKKGLLSMRQKANLLYKTEVAKMTLMTKETGELTYYRPVYFDIRLSNFCNLRCRTCGPLSSSSWNKDEPSLLKLPATAVEEFKTHLSYAKEVYFAGGEPLIMVENIAILEEIIQVNPNMRVEYNTNLTTLSFQGIKYTERWKKLGNLNLVVSLDDINERGGYLRTGLNFKILKANLNELVENKISFIFNVVVSSINVFSLGEIIEFFEKNYPDNYVDYTILEGPPWFMISSLSSEIKAKLEVYIKSLLTKEMARIHQKVLHKVLIELEIDDSHHFSSMIEHIRRLDEVRGDSFKEVYPAHPLSFYL